jgi:hypothetical protein
MTRRTNGTRWVRDELQARGHVVSMHQVERWIADGLIRSYRVGTGTRSTHRRVAPAEVERFAALLDAGLPKPITPPAVPPPPAWQPQIDTRSQAELVAYMQARGYK